MLSKLAELLKEHLVTYENEEKFYPSITIDFRLDETRAHARHSFLNKTYYFGPTDNDHNELAA